MKRRWDPETLAPRLVKPFFDTARQEIPLKPHFSGILTALRDVGECLLVSLNQTATLGVFSHYPALAWSGCEASVSDGSLLLDVGEWAAARAVRSKTPESERHSIEFLSSTGEIVHRVCVTARSDARRYREVVDAFADSDPVRPFPPPFAASREHKSGAAPRLSMSGEDAVRLFHRFAEERVAVHFAVGSPAAIQCAEFVPHTVREQAGELVYLGSGHAGSHIHVGAHCGIELEVADSMDGRLLMRFWRKPGGLCVILAPGRTVSGSRWNKLLHAHCKPFAE